MQFPAQQTNPTSVDFVDRRQEPTEPLPKAERRQFSDQRKSDRPEVDELARAIDDYKVRNRRRFITFEEIYDVMVSLGYHK
ncbi:hypothetical protein [Thalassoglobus sp.]|uniref:hypothetical protein n=1 Tax=Thalassoglobus sp. TaxID=2795869 RepID=UPI003AA7CAA6